MNNNGNGTKLWQRRYFKFGIAAAIVGIFVAGLTLAGKVVPSRTEFNVLQTKVDTSQGQINRIETKLDQVIWNQLQIAQQSGIKIQPMPRDSSGEKEKHD